MAVLGVNRNKMRVHGPHEQRVAQDGQSAIVRTAAGLVIGQCRILIGPEHAPGLRIERVNDVIALDAKTGRVFWTYQYTALPDHKACCGANNRGLAILGDTLFMGTVDAHLVAIDAKDGHPLWNTQVADIKAAYSLTVAPLAVKDKVIVGVGGGELGIRGFIAAYDAKTGKEVWRFYTVPGPGE